MSKLALPFVLVFVACSSAESTETPADAASVDTAVDDTGSAPSDDTMSPVEETMASADSTPAMDAPSEETLPGWKLVWSDEFDGADGSAVDPKKWKHDVGGHGFGNQEREYYTDGTENAQIKGGQLVITATKDGAGKYDCWYGKCEYTSARLLSAGLFQHTYGRFAARIQIPRGQGIWPAFWMLGANIGTKSWPDCGEIDIMENIGKEPKIVHGTIHGPGYSGAGGIGAPYSTPSMSAFADDFHVYAVEWKKDEIKWLVDDHVYETRTPTDLGGKTWVYDHDFFILLNLAVGGQWPGNPDGTTTFPQEMKVDWVRVYEPG
jgi:beta-glucanase (GH16 family)